MSTHNAISNNLAFIVEDDRDIADMYAEVVRGAGFLTEVFYDGKTAYDRLQRGPAPKLVLLDMHLPVVTGNEIAWELWFELEQTHIVMITADADMANIYRNKAEVDEVFVKPVPLDVLRDATLQYLTADQRRLNSDF